MKTFNENESCNLTWPRTRGNRIPHAINAGGLAAATFGDSIFVLAGGRLPGASESDLTTVSLPTRNSLIDGPHTMSSVSELNALSSSLRWAQDYSRLSRPVYSRCSVYIGYITGTSVAMREPRHKAHDSPH